MQDGVNSLCTVDMSLLVRRFCFVQQNLEVIDGTLVDSPWN